MSSCHIDVILTLLPAGWDQDRCVKKLSDLENEIYRVQYGVFLTIFGHELLLSLSAQSDYM